MAEQQTAELAAHLSRILTDAQAVIVQVQRMGTLRNDAAAQAAARDLATGPAFRQFVADVAGANAWLVAQAEQTVTAEMLSAEHMTPADLKGLFPDVRVGLVDVNPLRRS